MRETTKKRRTKQERSVLEVIVAGKKFTDGSAADVFVEAICHIGLEKVEALQLTLGSSPLVSRERPPRACRECGHWYVATHSSTAQKHSTLLDIARKLRREDIQVRLLDPKEQVDRLFEF